VLPTVIIAGGVSVGDYDYSKAILADLGVRTIFWKVSQKPGKPIYFGKKGRQLIFGLPGNPASAFVCFYEYAWPALRRQMGCRRDALPRRTAIADEDIRPDRFKTVFLKAKSYVRAGQDRIRILGRQASHMISSLHEANALAVISPGEKILPRGAIIAYDTLPFEYPGHVAGPVARKHAL
jgi:molybdopterin molybdotransferase